MSEKTYPKKYKIEGEAFQKIKEISERHIEIDKQLIKARAEAHDQLWKNINEALDLDPQKNHQLDLTNMDLGILIVEEKGSCCAAHDLLNDLTKTDAKEEKAA